MNQARELDELLLIGPSYRQQGVARLSEALYVSEFTSTCPLHASAAVCTLDNNKMASGRISRTTLTSFGSNPGICCHVTWSNRPLYFQNIYCVLWHIVRVKRPSYHFAPRTTPSR